MTLTRAHARETLEEESMNLADWINKEVHLRARQIEDGMARRLLMEAEHLSGLTEYEAKERLGILRNANDGDCVAARRKAAGVVGGGNA